MTTRSRHLTETEFNDAMLGLATDAVRRHLEACEACSEEAAQVEDSIRSFSMAATRWSRAQTAPTAVAFRSRALLHSLRPVMAFAVAALVVVSVAVPFGRHQQAMRLAAAQAAAVKAPEIAEATEQRVALARGGAARPQVSDDGGMIVETAEVVVSNQGGRDEFAYDNALMTTINAEISEPVYVAVSATAAERAVEIQMQ